MTLLGAFNSSPFPIGRGFRIDEEIEAELQRAYFLLSLSHIQEQQQQQKQLAVKFCTTNPKLFIDH